MSHITADSMHTSDGMFTILADEHAVLAAGWTSDPRELAALVHPHLRRPVHRASEEPHGLLKRAREAVEAYYRGDHRAPAAVPVHQRSGAFRESAWKTLREVLPGAPVSYTEYASRAGSPAAVRAAAAACAQNAAALFVPCHRVVRNDGSLGGFRYGLDVKQSLLDREAAAAE